MKQSIKLLAVISLTTLTYQTSFAQSCVQDPDCQQSKLEAMGGTSGISQSSVKKLDIRQVLKDVLTLKKIFNDLMISATDLEPEYGTARGEWRLEEIENEIYSLKNTHNRVSDKGRTLAEINDEVQDIMNAYKNSGR